MTILLATMRAIHLGALMVLFGADTLCQILHRKSLPGGTPFPPRLTAAAGATALVSASLWFVLVSADLTGSGGLASLKLTLGSTFFGQIFILRIAALLALTVAAFSERRIALQARIALSAVALVGIALTSHAAASGAPFIWRAANDALHLLAASFWIGGLTLLAPLALKHRNDPDFLVPALATFSPWAMGAVAVLVVAGTVNAILILGTAPSLWSSVYLTLLAAKLVLAALMVCLALTNRFSLLPSTKAGEAEAHENLVLSIIAELAIGLVIVAIVGVLGLLPYQR